MNRFDKLLLGAVTGAVLMIFSIALSNFYLEGSAKQDYLIRTQDISLPWYKAAYIDTGSRNLSGSIAVD